MNIEIISEPLTLTLYGVSGKVENQNYGGTGQQLMDIFGKEIGVKKLKHKGKNHWVYEEGDMLFTGVELEETSDSDSGLTLKKICLTKYVYWKHIGPYRELGKVHANLNEELKSKGLQRCFPSIEIYGHWTENESKLETDIIIAINNGID